MPAELEQRKMAIASQYFTSTRVGAVLSRRSEAGGHSGPVVVAHPLLDVVQFGLQIFAPALLHPIIQRLKRG